MARFRSDREGALSAVDDLLRNVLRSGLVSREELQTTLRSLAKERRDHAPATADHLIEKGKITRFQLHKLSRGITIGLVLGPYHLLTPLGRGGSGTVYLAIDARSNQHVALKILPPKIARQEERLLARFQREMEISQKVKHINIARTLDVGIRQGIHYIAMEYIPGTTLYRQVAGKTPLTVARVAHLISETAAGLGQAHAQGVIHRDMKPSNIMVTPRDHAKVLDLGLAYTQGEEVEDIEVVGGRGYIVGSIDYMAPEQTRDPTTVDARADLYALGCCMYFALTGRPPFPEGTVYQKVRAHRHEAPIPLRNLNAEVPDGFAAIVHKLLAKAPDERFASAVELTAALAPFRTGETGPFDGPSDAAYQQAIQFAITNWTPPEPSKEVADEDAVLFRIDKEERSAVQENLSRSLFEDVQGVPSHIWLLIFVGVWVGLLLICFVGSCVVSWTKGQG
jgi:serine/threonine protein kinase